MTKEQREELSEIESLYNRFLKATQAKNSRVIGDLFKELALREDILKAWVEASFMFNEEELAYIKNLQDRVDNTMKPYFDTLVKKACTDFVKFFADLNRGANGIAIKLTPTQLQFVYFLLDRVIRKADIKDLYTIVCSRGFGKSFLVAGVATFLFFNWDKYLVKELRYFDFQIAIVTEMEKHLTSTRTNCKKNIINLIASDGYGNYKVKRNNDEMLEVYRDEKPFATIYFRLSSVSTEGLHVNVSLVDEAKFIERSCFDTSILPILNGRSGSMFMISSADENYTYFQEIHEKNLEVFEGKGRKNFFITDLDTLCKERPSYLIAVQRAERQLGRDSIAFKTQYMNMFLAKKSSSFFNVQEAHRRGLLQPTSDFFAYTNPVVFGIDFATTGSDSSLLTIKSVEGYGGSNRTTRTIDVICLNPTRTENVLSQLRNIYDYIKMYRPKSIALDTTGLGNGADKMLIELMFNDEMIDELPIYYKYVFPVVFSKTKKNEVLNLYHQRLEEGLEIFPLIDEGLIKNLDDMKRMYLNSYRNYYSLDYMSIKLLYEHHIFVKDIIKDEETMTEKIIWGNKMGSGYHDDTIYSSALASYALHMFPDLGIEEVTNTMYITH